MIYVRDSAEALKGRKITKSPGSGAEHWNTVFFGARFSTEPGIGPHSVMTEMVPNEVVLQHFHGVTQFQIFPAGSGKIGKKALELKPLIVQYKDHHTAYGPITAGPQGLTFMSLRIKTGDAMPIYLDRPGYREKLKPSRRRNLFTPPLELSTEQVLKSRTQASWEPLFPADKTDDGMAAHMLRLGPGMAAMGPDPRIAAGYYVFVANGGLSKDGAVLPLWSMVVVEPTEDAFEIKAGENGLEALVLQFPIENE